MADHPQGEGDRPQPGGSATRVITRQKREPHAHPTVTSRTRLGDFVSERGVTPVVAPGLDPDGPSVDGVKGDGRYALGAELGVGGVGRVCLAADRDLRRTVALKTLLPEHAEEPVMLRAFLEEAVIAGGLEHPNIVPVYEAGYSDAFGPYYTMKKVAGETLDRVLSRLRDGAAAPSLDRLMETFAQALRAIAYAHERKVIHCDLKPSNMVVGRYGEVVVVDWGLAKVLGEAGRDQARSQLWSGSPGYMAPEQAVDLDVDVLQPQSDVWSLGAILYELLTLTLPFADPDGALPEDILWREIDPPRHREIAGRPIPEALEALCMKALSKDPARRPADAGVMLRTVETWLDGSRAARRRDEAASSAVVAAQRQLDAVAAKEQVADALLSVGGLGATGHGGASLLRSRQTLMDRYESATTALIAGLSARPDDDGLQQLAGDVYWRVFRRVYPSQVPPPAELQARALSLLGQLSSVAMRGIVAAADRDGAAPEGPRPSGSGGDPWLAAVLRVAEASGLLNDGSPIARLLAKIRCLAAAPMFEALGAVELLPIAVACDDVLLRAGDRLFAEGDPGDALYVVERGEVAIERGGKRLAVLGTRRAFGEVAILDGATRTAGARALVETRLLRLKDHSFHAIIAADGRTALSVMRVLARRLRAATEREAAS